MIALHGIHVVQVKLWSMMIGFLFYVIGDEAFACTNNFLTPYSGCGLGPWNDAFNF
jgi:hypothetical protein